MKNVLLVFCTFCFLAVSSCSRTDRCSELVCTNDCVFVEVDQVGVVHYYGCYDVWGVLFTDENEESIIALAPDMKPEFQVEDMELTFSATFYENDLPLAFPDPMPGRFYKIDICDMIGNRN